MARSLRQGRWEIKSALVAAMHGVANPRTDECGVEPHGVPECRSSLNIHLEAGLCASGAEMCTPEYVPCVEAIVACVEYSGRRDAGWIDSGGVVGCHPEGVRVPRLDFWETIGRFLGDLCDYEGRL